MAPAFSPPISTESHTLSAESFKQPGAAPQDLLAVLRKNPDVPLQPSKVLHAAALTFAKQYLDPLAFGVSNTQLSRQAVNRRKRRRAERGQEEEDALRIKRVHLEGFGVDQIWEQARKVIYAARKEAEAAASKDEEGEDEDIESVNGDAEEKADTNGTKTVHFDEDGFEIGSDEDVEEDDIDDAEDDAEIFEDEEEEEASEEEFDEEAEDMALEGVDDYDEDDYDEEEAGPAQEFVEDLNGLNDGFFSIDDFNRQSEFLERQDEKGDPDDGAASDEEEVDWAADPLAAVGSKQLGINGKHKDEEESDDEDEDGPTFGDMDINVPDGESDMEEDDEFDDEEMGDMGDLGNTNDVLYADFFAPPAKKANKNKRGRPHPHNFPQQDSTKSRDSAPHIEGADDVERTMSAVHRDLFSESDEASEEETEQLDPGDPKSRRSTHERRQAALAEEIRKLEAANIAKREWTLAGEARAADRPLNSLLEEDLEFERIGKPVPVITAEVSEDIEAMIKRRIIAREFDEVIRRRPESLGGPDVRRGKMDFELSDQKSKQGLAELYEEEHLRHTDPAYVDVKDEKLKQEHKEIEGLWKEVSGKLDALSSWHYKPKPTAPQLEVRVDAPVLSMEDARPTAGGEVSGASALAPQEVYKPGEVKTAGEIVTKGGLPVNHEELSREQKKRRRRRDKERTRKAGGVVNGNAASNKKEQERSNIISDLKKGSVKVIGKKGELRDVDGSKAKRDLRAITGGAFKL
ncbi:Mpp10 protein [Rhizodiscina lignyota]|uniref:U3 small nucleolar ribonucleoprotein protein MPP10 n=1 Tax=Rhizodiscina lignyota TaxID=1504668 RepID=A0A9P4IMH8_9PEZI|nr:Mpp10 protein [Rhizodiscina lignyota]